MTRRLNFESGSKNQWRSRADVELGSERRGRFSLCRDRSFWIQFDGFDQKITSSHLAPGAQ
jgi:hypothetical protein